MTLLVVAIVLGAGIGIGGYWIYDNYFPSPSRSLEKAQNKFKTAEEVFAANPLAAERYYKDVDVQLDKLADRAVSSDMANNVPGFLLRAKVLWRLGDIARARDKGPEGIAAQGRYQAAGLKLYEECLSKYDKDNVEAASAL